MEILPMIISEEDIACFDTEELSILASCTTDALLPFIRDYLDSPDADMAVQMRVAEAYRQRLVQLDFLKSDSLDALVKELSTVTLRSITATTPVILLKRWKQFIEIALYDESSAMYLAPIQGDVIKDLAARLKANEDDASVDVSKRLAKNAKFFRDPRNSTFKGTVLKQVLKRQGEYKIISDGISWLLKRLEAGDNPSLWRIL